MTEKEFDFSIDLMQSLLWQYNDATRLQALIQQKQDWLNTEYTEFWQNWIRDVFDLRTANDFGLQVWAIILGVTLAPETGSDGAGKKVFGFDPYHQNFNNGNFSKIQGAVIKLTTAQKRLILQLRYYQLVARGTVPEINFMLSKLFPNGAWVIDTLDMSFVTYVFSSRPNSHIQFILDNYDLLPRPAGVGVKYWVADHNAFGFNHGRTNFYNAHFGQNS
jgi:hypothetical protein